MRHLVFGLVMALLLSSSSALASQSSTMAFVTDSATIPGTLLLVNVASGQSPVPVSVGSAPFGVAVLPDGSRVYVSNRGFGSCRTSPNGTISVIYADGTLKTTIPVQKMPMGVAAGPDGRVYVANNCSHSLSVINTANEMVDMTVSLMKYGSLSPRGVAANPIATMPYVYVTNRGSDDLAVVNTNDWSVVRITGIGNDPFGVAVAKDGKTIYVALEGDGKLAVVNAITLLVDARIDVGPFGSNTGPTGVAVGRDGRVYVTNTESNSVWVVDLTKNPVTSVSKGVGAKPVGVAVSPDGSRVYVANSMSASLSVISTSDGRVLDPIELPGSTPFAFGNYVWGPTAIPVAIDIKPGSNQNTINLGSHGVTPVAILSSSVFNAPVLVNPATVTLAGAPVQLKGDGVTAVVEERDVNGDGFVDLVVHVQTDAMVVPQGETAVVLEGKTWTGDDIRGEGTVRIVPGK